MRVYSFGADDAPTLLLLPGTCCHWHSNFGHVIPLLERDFHVLCVSYDGFDETERTEFPTMPEETERIGDYIHRSCGGHIWGAYGCSLGGSFVGLLAARPEEWAALVRRIACHWCGPSPHFCRASTPSCVLCWGAPTGIWAAT